MKGENYMEISAKVQGVSESEGIIISLFDSSIVLFSNTFVNGEKSEK